MIAAFNENMPFDQFTIEQMAGDLLPNRTLRQQIASGFNRCNMTTNEGGAINEEYLVLYARDRTETAAQVWLGLTVGCAVCHDHKFDPFSQKEFYQLSAFFNNTSQAAMDGNVKDTPPVVTVPKPDDAARWEALPAEIKSLRERLVERKRTARPDFESWLTSAQSETIASGPGEGIVFRAPLDDGVGGAVGVYTDGQHERTVPATDVAWEEGYVGPWAPNISADETIEISDAGDREKDEPYTVSAWVKLTKANQSGSVDRADG